MGGVPRSSPSSRPAATRDDVAQLAGVSTAVVSYVVNGSKGVSPKTAAKVHDAIARLGYRPNPTARALRLGSAEMIGMVVPDATNPFFAGLTHAVELAAGARGYTLLSANSDNSLETEHRNLEKLATRQVNGIILCSTVFAPDVRSPQVAGVPVVLLNHGAEFAGVDSVGVDLRGGARLAVAHLAEHGRDTIGLITGTTVEGVRDPRETGWREAVKEFGLRPGPVIEGPFSPAGGYEAGRSLLAGGTLPPALFVASDRLALGLLRALHEAGVRVPRDMAIVSFDGSTDSEYSWPPLTTIAQPVDEMAVAAVEALVGGAAPRRHHGFVAALVRRASCGCGR